jgi:hypothetical protein
VSALSKEDRKDIRELHSMGLSGSENIPCRGCHRYWPCPSVKALDALEEAEAELKRHHRDFQKIRNIVG